MIKRFLQFTAILCVVGVVENKKHTNYHIIIEDVPSEIEGKEDLAGRLSYELLLTADPKTGDIPLGIRLAELAFTKQIDSRTSNQRTATLSFQSAGPYNVGGRVRAVAFDVRDENVIIAGGVSGGVWKSTDGGMTWVKKSSPENRNSVTCLVQDTRLGKEDTWYHGTGEIVGNSASIGLPSNRAPFRGNGIYKSTDNGETWNPIPSTQDSDPQVFNSQFQYIWDIEVNEQNLIEDEILVAAYGGILRSVDGGNTWNVELGKALFNLPDDVDLNNEDASFYTALEQSSDGIFYATLSTETSTENGSSEAGIYISKNGTEWVNITPFTSESRYRRIVIGTSKSSPAQSYFLVDTNPTLILEHTISRFDDAELVHGFNIRETPNLEGELGAFNTQGSYNMMIRVHPENHNVVYAGGTNLYRSTDGFASSDNTSWVGGYNPEGGASVYPNHHPDQHDLLFYPSYPNKLLSASDGGLIVSDDGLADSVKWESINNGFLTSQFFTIALSKENGNPAMIGGMQDNGTDLTIANGLADWQPVIGGDGGYAATTRDNFLWFASFQNGQILRLTFDQDYKLSSFGRVDPEGLVRKAGSDFLFINPFILDPVNQNRMFVAGGNHLYFNANVSQIPGGTQKPATIGWVQVTKEPLTNGIYSALDLSLDGQVLYFGASNGHLYKLSNADDELNFSLEEVTSDLFPEGGYVSSIAINPENPDHLMVTYSNYSVVSIFESTNGGRTFQSISGNLEENADGSGSGPSIRWGEIIPTTAGTRYMIGSSTGLFSAEATEGDLTVWTKESVDLIGSSVVTMMDYRPGDGRLAIATHGNGVFTTDVVDFKPIQYQMAEEAAYVVLHAAPNPFTDVTKIRFTIPADGLVKIDLYSPQGVLVKNLLWARQYEGTNEVTWDGTNTGGSVVANGVYHYQILYEDQVLTGRLIFRR